MPVPQVQRAFLAWLSQQTLAVPVEVTHRTRRYVVMGFPTLAAQALEATLIGHREINVSVEWQGEFWDLIFCQDGVEACRIAQGWVCSSCVEHAALAGMAVTTYPNRETLWREHLFAPFADWINTTLAQGDTLALVRYGQGSTAACLLPPDTRRIGTAADRILLPLTTR